VVPRAKDLFDVLVLTTNPFDLLDRIYGGGVTAMVTPIGIEEVRMMIDSAEESGVPVVVQTPKDLLCPEIHDLVGATELPRDLSNLRVFIVAVTPNCRFYALALLNP